MRRRSPDCSQAAVPGADFCGISRESKLARLVTTPGALSGARVSTAAPRGYPGGEKTHGRGWVGGLQQVGFGLLDWRPYQEPPGVCQAGRAASDSASEEVTLAWSPSHRAG